VVLPVEALEALEALAVQVVLVVRAAQAVRAAQVVEAAPVQEEVNFRQAMRQPASAERRLKNRAPEGTLMLRGIPAAFPEDEPSEAPVRGEQP
jgi:hypothetical protein